MAQRAEAPSFFTRLIVALRPGFRPRGRDFLVPGGVFLVALPFVVGFSWTGNAIEVLGVLGLAFLLAAPIALIALVVAWKRKTRAALQVFLCALAIVPLMVVADATQGASIWSTIRRGDKIVAEIKKYRESHWRYPRSLEALERSIGRTLPRPSVADKFYYEGGLRSFKLRFHYPIMGCKEYHSLRGYWRDAPFLFF